MGDKRIILPDNQIYLYNLISRIKENLANKYVMNSVHI